MYTMYSVIDSVRLWFKKMAGRTTILLLLLSMFAFKYSQVGLTTRESNFREYRFTSFRIFMLLFANGEFFYVTTSTKNYDNFNRTTRQTLTFVWVPNKKAIKLILNHYLLWWQLQLDFYWKLYWKPVKPYRTPPFSNSISSATQKYC